MRRLLAGLLALVAAGLAVLGLLAWSSLPRTTGRIAVTGIEAPVAIVRDGWGVPHIRAGSAGDAYFAVGFAHAQDRLWQMEMNRRIAQGRLAEIVGERALPLDRLMRTLGLYALAQAGVERLDPRVRGHLEAYAAGVNAFLATRRGALPLEFQLLWHDMAPWRVADSLVWPKVMALDLAKNWRDEALRVRLATVLGPAPEAFDDLFPGPPHDAPVSLGGSGTFEATFGAVPGAGSNVWVAGGATSRTGAAMLANDPHLRLTSPSVWYLAHLETPEFTVAGATMPSMPMVVIGRNRRIAWGFTNSGADVQDLFVERVVDEEQDHYRTPDGTAAFEVTSETLEVRGGEPQRLEARRSRHGPVISDLAPYLAAPGTAVALRWSALEPDDRTIEAGFALARAGDRAEFEAAVALFQSPPQNVAYADAAGHVGLVLAGRIPVRAAGDGRWPVDGASGRFDWRGFVDPARLPRRFDPPSGILFNANNALVAEDAPLFLTRDWDPALRARRLGTLLEAAPFDAADMAAMQGDLHSTLADDFLPPLLEVPPTEATAEILEALRVWDRRARADRPEPLIFARWYDAWVEAVLADELGPAFAAYAGVRAEAMAHIVEAAPHWCDDRTTAAVRESCVDRAAVALGRAVAALRREQGDDWRGWRRPAAAGARLAHRPFDGVPVLGDFFGATVAKDGDPSTLDVAHRAEAPPHRVVAAASMRMIVDWSRPETLEMVIGAVAMTIPR